MGHETYCRGVGPTGLSSAANMDSLFSTGAKTRECIGAVLKHVLADESQLALATRGYVWRVRGSPLQSLTRLFTEQGRQIDRWVGEVATQARAFGVALGGARGVEAGESSQTGANAASPQVMIGELLALHEDMAVRLRKDVSALEENANESDAATFLAGLLEFHETTAWMLRMVLTASTDRREVTSFKLPT
jgi:starvation-inducible DNA-binding protein